MYQHLQLSTDSIIVEKYGGTSLSSVEKIQTIAARVARQYRKGWRRLVVVVSAMSGETNRLVGLAAGLTDNIDPACYDMIVSSGEQISTGLMAAALITEGVGARPMLAHQLGLYTDQRYGNANIEKIDQEVIFDCWQQGIIPVVAGFQGMHADSGTITTLGRSGSDTTAVAIAAVLKADLCEINTDVDGIFSADPNVVSGAKLIKTLDYNIAREMAVQGSQVLHPKCIETGAKYNIPLIVRHAFDADHSTDYTLVSHMPSAVSSISLDLDVVRVSLLNLSAGRIGSLFDELAMAGVNIDVIVHNHLNQPSNDSVTNAHLGFSVLSRDVFKTVSILEGLQSLEPALQFTIEHDLAKVSLIGAQMVTQPGVAAEMFQILEKAQIDIRMISTSDVKISCVIQKPQAKKACQLLHRGLVENSIDQFIIPA